MRIFISYSSKIRPQVTALADDLEQAGHDPWFDQELIGGRQWWAEILRNIRECDVFMLALAPETLASEPCQRELEYAQALGKPVIPITLRATEVESLPLELQQIQIVDYRTRDADTALKLARALHHAPILTTPPDPLPPPPPVPIAALDAPTQPGNPLVSPPRPGVLRWALLGVAVALLIGVGIFVVSRFQTVPDYTAAPLDTTQTSVLQRNLSPSIGIEVVLPSGWEEVQSENALTFRLRYADSIATFAELNIVLVSSSQPRSVTQLADDAASGCAELGLSYVNADARALPASITSSAGVACYLSGINTWPLLSFSFSQLTSGQVIAVNYAIDRDADILQAAAAAGVLSHALLNLHINLTD